MTICPSIVHETTESEDTRSGFDRWLCWIFNNDVTPFIDVVVTLMEATGCGHEEAYAETWEAHTFGKAVCHIADRDECTRVARIMNRIGVQTAVTKEWE